MGYSSPNRVVWMHFEWIKRALQRAELAEKEEDRVMESVLCIILSITAIEVFVSIYFRVLAENTKYIEMRESLINDINSPYCSLEKLLKKWPKMLFGKGFYFSKGIGKEFSELKSLRNKLVHFTSTHEEVKIHSMIIKGMANTDIIYNISVSDAMRAVEIAEKFIEEIFNLSGIDPLKNNQFLHAWIGKVSF